jgi:hypothetical protein
MSPAAEGAQPYVLGRWREFLSPEYEAAYRVSALPGDLQRARLLLWLTSIGALLFISQDFVTFGLRPGFYIGLTIRVAAVATCALALYRLRRPITPAAFERWMVGFGVLLAVLVLFGYATRPVPRMGHGLIALSVFALGMAVPLRWRHQVTASVLFFVLAMVALALKRPDPFILYGTFFVTALSVALGTITAASIHGAQRSRFAAHESEIRLREEVQAALAEIKTLRGLLPICASCKNIRSDDGAWSRIEAYLSEHTYAQFTHGICPDCRVKLYPETLPAEASKHD